MNRRAFFGAFGVLLAAPVAAWATQFEPIGDITHATYGFWRSRASTTLNQSAAYQNLHTAMREVYAQCQGNYGNNLLDSP